MCILILTDGDWSVLWLFRLFGYLILASLSFFLSLVASCRRPGILVLINETDWELLVWMEFLRRLVRLSIFCWLLHKLLPSNFFSFLLFFSSFVHVCVGWAWLWNPAKWQHTVHFNTPRWIRSSDMDNRPRTKDCCVMFE